MEECEFVESSFGYAEKGKTIAEALQVEIKRERFLFDFARSHCCRRRLLHLAYVSTAEAEPTTSYEFPVTRATILVVLEEYCTTQVFTV